MNHHANRQRRKIRQSKAETGFDIFIYVFTALFTLLCFYPFYYILINTISSNELSAAGKIILLPKQMHFVNYMRVFKIPGISQAAFISIARTVLGTVSAVFVSGYLGFMFTQERMWLRKVWYRFILITMYFSAGLIPFYLLIMNLGLLNNFLFYIIPGLVQPFNIILVKTYIESTPKALQESAELDGAGLITIYTRIIIPLIKPILATIAIFTAVGHWNSFMDTVIYMTNEKLYTLQFVLYQYHNQAATLARLIQEGGVTDAALDAMTKQTETSIRMTVTIVVMLPILFTYPFFQRYFVKGIMVGAVKG